MGPKVERPSGIRIQIVDSRWVPEVERRRRYPLMKLEASCSITFILSFVNTLWCEKLSREAPSQFQAAGFLEAWTLLQPKQGCAKDVLDAR